VSKRSSILFTFAGGGGFGSWETAAVAYSTVNFVMQFTCFHHSLILHGLSRLVCLYQMRHSRALQRPSWSHNRFTLDAARAAALFATARQRAQFAYQWVEQNNKCLSNQCQFQRITFCTQCVYRYWIRPFLALMQQSHPFCKNWMARLVLNRAKLKVVAAYHAQTTTSD